MNTSALFSLFKHSNDPEMNGYYTLHLSSFFFVGNKCTRIPDQPKPVQASMAMGLFPLLLYGYYLGPTMSYMLSTSSLANKEYKSPCFSNEFIAFLKTSYDHSQNGAPKLCHPHLQFFPFQCILSVIVIPVNCCACAVVNVAFFGSKYC